MIEKLTNKIQLQILFLVFLILIFSSFFNLFGYFISEFIWSKADVLSALSGNLDTGNSIVIMKFFQFLNELSVFLFPPLVLYFFIKKRNKEFLHLNKCPNLLQLLGLLLLFVFTLPIVNHLIDWNSGLHLPSYMSGVENWMREEENSAALVTAKFLNVNSGTGFLSNIFVIALLPAIGEELIFRGLLIHWFSKVLKNIHVNIFVVAIIFSAIHVQFFGFFPRLFLGIILGYVFYWTGSLWSSIFLHFINNSFSVIVYYIVNASNKNIDPEKVINIDGIGYLVLSILFTCAIGFWFYKNKVKTTFN